MSTPSILILFAHPAFERSKVQSAMVAAIRDLPGLTFHDLYQAYPDFDIDPKREQKLLSEHHTVVMQHPLYWYSTPAMLKQWQDLVLEHGWAYGEKGTALRGKRLLSAISTGGQFEAYTPQGFHKHTVRQLMAPIAQTAALCGMHYLEPFAIHGSHALTPDEAKNRAQAYRKLLIELSSFKDAHAPR